ncbi:hypothetical protein J1N35_020837 [Gossypium stocksii]|uniref:Uncharacterized protein n=1 Tax=Gossypium stocksii TaxID=47602 RepID=A0A9D3VE33_9ROSI|nr:hypothetical protein J1N35_020837 [Gossypium stocksii]
MVGRIEIFKAKIVTRREADDGVASIVTGLLDDEFNESEELSDFNMFDNDDSETLNNVGMNEKDKVRVNLDGLNMNDIKVGELSDSDDFEILSSAHESDLEGKN